MRSQLVVATLAHLRAQQKDVAALCARHGVPSDAEARGEAVLPLDALRAFFDDAARMLDDPLLGVHMARAMNRGAFGVLAFSSRLAPTVREALARLSRYIRLSNDTVEVGFEEDAREGVIRQRVPGRAEALGRHANEFFVAVLLEEGRHALGAALQPSRVFVAHDRPRGVDLAAALGVPRVEYGAGANGLAFPRALLDQPFSAGDPSLLSYLDAQAQKALSDRDDGKGFLGEVRRVVRADLNQGTPNLARSARLCGMSRRTLQRRLEEEGTSFQRLVDEAREDVSRTLVADPSVPLSRVARVAGYADERPFLRAFKRWTGQTPTAYREGRKS